MTSKKPDIEALKRKAEDGDAEAQNELGLIYARGEFVKKNLSLAAKFFEKAANNGLSEAQFHIGWCYESGKGVKADLNEAIKWYRKASKLGNPAAQKQLAVFYHKGNGVKKNLRMMYKYLELSANSSYKYAQYSLGYYIQRKTFHWINEADCVKWYEKAAINNLNSAKYNLAMLYLKGMYVPENVDKALELLERAANEEHVLSMLLLARMYERGIGVKQNTSKMFRWYFLASDYESADAQRILGDFYKNGTHVDKDFEKAIEWYEKAAYNNDEYSISFLAEYYSDVENFDRYSEQAIFWLKRASKIEYDFDAQYRLGMCYYYGKGVAQNYREAKKLFHWVTCVDESPEAEYMLAQCYKYGHGTTINEKKSYDHMHIAACSGHYEAILELSMYYRDGIGTEQDYQQSYITANICHALNHKLIPEVYLSSLKEHLTVYQIDEAESQAEMILDQNTSGKGAYNFCKKTRIQNATEPISLIKPPEDSNPFNNLSEETGDPEPSSGLAYKYVGNIRKNFDPSLVEFELVVPRKWKNNEDMDFTHIRIRYDRRDTDVKAIDQFKKHKINAKQRRILICLAAQNSAGDEEKSAKNIRKILLEDSSGPDISRLNKLFNLIFPNCLPSNTVRMINRQSGLVNIRLRIDTNKIINARDYGSCRL